jgi:predicted Zn-dependent peptidase
MRCLRLFRSFGTALALSALSAGASAAPPPAPVSVQLPIQRVMLDNGLRVVMNVDRSAPTVAVAVTYDVGSRDEEPGKSGFAHLFEHLMFGATKNLAEGELQKLVLSRGGFLSATTHVDRTPYFMVVPENEMALALWLEAERMRSVDVSQKSFEAERKVMEEEHRLRVDNAPYGKAYWALGELVFQGAHAYAHPVPGALSDLGRAELGWVRAFHASHYGPNTAVLSLSGDFDPDAAMALVHRHFDAIPRIAAKPFAEQAVPEQASERRRAVEDAVARLPGLEIGFATPPPRTREHDALRMIAVILGDGDTARLPAELVRKDALCTEASAELDRLYGRGPGILRIALRLAEGASVGEVEKRVDAAIGELAGRPPSAAEMTRARRRLETAFTLGLAWNRDRAIELGKYEIYHGDARLIGRELERLAQVTAEDVQKAAARYLAPARKSVVETRPAGAPGAPKESK